MANRKGNTPEVKDTRPTLAEIRQQPGNNLFVTYEGVEHGTACLPPRELRFAGDVAKDLVIKPWEYVLITEDWLSDVEFIKLYTQDKGIRVVKADERPAPRALKLPEEIAKDLTDAQQLAALNVAQSPYNEQMQDVVQIENKDLPPIAADRWENEKVYPFLEAILFFEEKLLNRKTVVRDIKARLRKIDAKAETHNKRRAWR